MKNIPILIVTLVIGIVMVVTAVIPLAADYSEAKTFKNEGYYYMDEVGPNDNISVFFDHNDPRNVIVNGIKILMPDKVVTIIGSTDFMIRYYYNTPTIGQIHAYFAGNIGVYADSNLNQDMAVEISGQTITVTSSGENATTRSFTSSDTIYCISPDIGEYVMKKYDAPVYMGNQDLILIDGRTVVTSSTSVSLAAKGNIENGMGPVNIYFYNAETTAGDITLHYDTVSGYVDLYKLDNMTFSLTQGNTVIEANYSAFIVSAEVTADPDNPDTFKNMIRIVPLMAFVGLIAVAATMIYLKGKE